MDGEEVEAPWTCAPAGWTTHMPGGSAGSGRTGCAELPLADLLFAAVRAKLSPSLPALCFPPLSSGEPFTPALVCGFAAECGAPLEVDGESFKVGAASRVGAVTLAGAVVTIESLLAGRWAGCSGACVSSFLLLCGCVCVAPEGRAEGECPLRGAMAGSGAAVPWHELGLCILCWRC